MNSAEVGSNPDAKVKGGMKKNPSEGEQQAFSELSDQIGNVERINKSKEGSPDTKVNF